MKFLVTGATGFVGNHLIRRLWEDNHEIVVLTRDVPRARKKLPSLGLHFHLWEAEKEPAPMAAFEGVDAVFHLAGESVAGKRWSEKQKQKIYDSRVVGTLHLVQTINSLTQKPKTLISTSAMGIYGDQGSDVIREEMVSKQDSFLVKVCKRWEKEAGRVSPQVRLAILRVSLVLGGDGGALKRMLLPFKLGLGGRLGRGTQWMSWIHVLDLVETYLFLAAHQNCKGVFNAVSPNPVTNLEYTRTLGAVLKRPAIFPVPETALKVLFGEMAELFLHSQRLSAQKFLDAGFKFKFIDLKTALENLLKSQF